MWIIFGMLVGVGIGYWIPYQLPVVFSKYVSVSFLAGLDSVLGGSRAGIEERFDGLVFTSGFFFNLILAGVLTYVGDLLGVELYLAAVVTFGVRVFENLAIIRRDLINRPPKKPPTLSRPVS
jgi:small basic protein